ncbi:GAF domain-containing protein [Altericista sp. CCNU0014]|uniref:GAF domain-containing protein n=1 Tax=Altericista sp. CCNU0014 TaxID=3082949 RepID=UPI00384CC252
MSQTQQQLATEIEALQAEVARLKAALKQACPPQIDQSWLVNEIATQIRRSLDLEEVLETTVTEIRRFLATDRVIIFCFEPDRVGRAIAESVGAEWRSIRSISIHDPCFSEQYADLYQQGHVSANSDICASGFRQCYIDMLAQFQVRANLVVPILQGEGLWGLLIAHHCCAPRSWQPEEISLLQKLATQVGIAIQQAELYQQSQRELMERKRNEIVLREMSEALGNAVEGISRLDAQGRYIAVNEAYAHMAGYQPEEMLGMDWRKTVHPEDLDKLTAAYQAMVADGKVEVEARGVRKDRVVFYKQLFMVSAYNDRKQFTGHHCFMKDIGERKQAEAVLQRLNQDLESRVQIRTAELSQVNCDLQQELRFRQQAEAALQRQIARERVLQSITQKIRQSLDLCEVLPTAVDEVRQLLQADRALIFQLVADGTGAVVQESVLPDYPVTAEMRFPDEWFSQACYEYYCQGNPRIVPDVAVDDWAACLAEFMASVCVKSKIVAPIVQRRKDGSPFVWGLLIVHACSDYRQWQQDEAELLQQIADQMAIALQQAELYQQLQQELRERRQTQASLQQSEALFRSLSEASPIGIFRNDAEGKCIYTNPRYREITGATLEETLGDGWQQFIHPEDLKKLLPERSADMLAKQESSVELRHVRKDGTVRLCKIKAAPILSTTHDLLGYVGTVEDITESRAIEQMKNEFISIVSHELRTPLASIRGSLGLLASDVLKDDPDTAQHMLDIATIETERLVRLVSDILDLERLESNKVVLDKQWCSAATLMQQSIEVLQPLAEENQIHLSCSPLSAQIWVAPDRIIQTLVNLLGNAIKFSPPSSHVTLTASIQANRILFQVRDRGRGIPAHKLEEIFGRFQQVDASDSRNEGGTGLGLAICRNIVQQHGGKIWVESVVGKGSTFYFTIPIPTE